MIKTIAYELSQKNTKLVKSVKLYLINIHKISNAGPLEHMEWSQLNIVYDDPV